MGRFTALAGDEGSIGIVWRTSGDRPAWPRRKAIVSLIRELPALLRWSELCAQCFSQDSYASKGYAACQFDHTLLESLVFATDTAKCA